MSTWNDINGKKNDHVCPYLSFDRSHNVGFFGYHVGKGFCCKQNNYAAIPKNSVADLCYDTNNMKDVYETCEIFLKSRNPFSK